MCHNFFQLSSKVQVFIKYDEISVACKILSWSTSTPSHLLLHSFSIILMHSFMILTVTSLITQPASYQFLFSQDSYAVILWDSLFIFTFPLRPGHFIRRLTYPYTRFYFNFFSTLSQNYIFWYCCYGMTLSITFCFCLYILLIFELLYSLITQCWMLTNYSFFFFSCFIEPVYAITRMQLWSSIS